MSILATQAQTFSQAAMDPESTPVNVSNRNWLCSVSGKGHALGLPCCSLTGRCTGLGKHKHFRNHAQTLRAGTSCGNRKRPCFVEFLRLGFNVSSPDRPSPAGILFGVGDSHPAHGMGPLQFVTCMANCFRGIALSCSGSPHFGHAHALRLTAGRTGCFTDKPKVVMLRVL